MKQNKGNKQVSLAGAARPQKQKRSYKALWRALAILAVLAVLLIAGVLLFKAFEEEEKPSLSARDMVEYTYTPDSIANNVSYYLLGVTGEKVGDPLDMLAVMCYDRKAQNVSMLQIPVATYIDKDTGFAVDTIGDVWSNPQPEVFCSSCRIRLSEEEIENNAHVTCGAKTEQRTGSAVGDLIRVINDQYGLPIDNYLLIPREGLVELIDGVEGVEVELSKKTTLAGETYKAGVRTLDGQAAVEYAVTYNYKKTPASDRDRMTRQRQVLASLWQRIAALEMDDLYYVNEYDATGGIIGRLMIGAHSVRYNTSSFGKARLLGISESSAADMKFADAMARFAYAMGRVPLEQVTISILPGDTAKTGTVKVYSVNREQLTTVLNDQMNPCELTLDDTTVTAPQVTEVAKEVDRSTVTLDTVLPVVETGEGEE